ncbi:phosphate transport system regulatory protein PhoU [Gandjariella thermophila]|uniref:Phosphate transport system regulatory protein PhoU n=1 Tax=Gandjariella thermophila TaxID=1931992 RepID=A0A4D4JAN3_9PSEU|nr:phosphate transport system regulatory protein PhoU [Gandjariella thermophila]
MLRSADRSWARRRFERASRAYPGVVREAYHRQLDVLVGELADMSDMARGAMEDATTALLDVDLARSERVIGGDPRIDRARTGCEHHAYALIALQAPVATELRTVLTTALAAEDLERMGDLARHVAELVRLRHPAPVLPEELRPLVTELHRSAVAVAEVAGQVIRTGDLVLARSADTLDDDVDERHRELLRRIAGQEWRHGVRAAVDASLLGRYYERFADHAVSVCARMVYGITGRPPGGHTGGSRVTVAA